MPLQQNPLPNHFDRAGPVGPDAPSPGDRGFEISVNLRAFQPYHKRFGKESGKEIARMLYSTSGDTIDSPSSHHYGSDNINSDPLRAYLGPVGKIVGGSLPPGEFPRIARLRANLTALSQQFDLYFVAYQDQIWVYQPGGLNVLEEPLLSLCVPPSQEACMVGGYVNRAFGHQINHIRVGNLGRFEIICMTYDDGDVIAFYTHHIAQCIGTYFRNQQVSRERQKTLLYPKACFHENVGRSAWGIAIHAKSRLIAVSSNFHEVTVFAFALSHENAREDFMFGPFHVENDHSPPVWSGLTAIELYHHMLSRSRFWRIVLPLPPRANNIPSIDFIEDALGYAEKVVAVDITGHIWILEIWKPGERPVRLYANFPPNADQSIVPLRGWGILVLKSKDFTEVNGLQDLVGADGRPTAGIQVSHQAFDISGLVAHVKNNVDSGAHSKHSIFDGDSSEEEGHPDGDVDDIEDEDDLDDEDVDYMHDDGNDTNIPAGSGSAAEPSVVMTNAVPVEEEGLDATADYVEASSPPQVPLDANELSRDWSFLDLRGSPPRSPINFEAEMNLQFRPRKIVVPALGHVYPHENMADFFEFYRHRNTRRALMRFVPWYVDKARLSEHVKSTQLIMRTSVTGVELYQLALRAPVVCNGLLRRMTTHEFEDELGTTAPLPWDMQNANIAQRVHLPLHVPELNLVVAGSLCGRIALLTLTRLAAAAGSPESTDPNAEAMRWASTPQVPVESIHSRGPPVGFVQTHPLAYEPPDHAYRCDWILPRQSDEERGIRPFVTLHGLAISPLPDPHADLIKLAARSSQPGVPRRYRLILHYADHTILQYDIERRGSLEADLQVFHREMD